MKGSVAGLLVVVSVALLAVWLPQFTADAGNPEIVERWVATNHLQVKVDGRWQEVPLVPLSQRACRSNDPLYRPYCD